AWLSGPGYPPRQSAINQVVTALFNAKSTSIGGCLVLPDGDKAWICREFNAVAQIRAATGACWDRRWILSGPGAGTAEVRALGERGLLSLPDWRVSGRPRLALQASPAVWKGDDLLAAPLAGYPNGWRAELAPDWPEFYASFLSH
ncbi:MAG: tRNA(Ile)-lysidine synthetase, partial [Pseudomonadota bacterium]